MNQTNKLIVGASLLSLAVTGGLVAMTQAASNTEDTASSMAQTERRFERGEMKENMTAVKEAVENNDYQAWVDAMSEHPHADDLDLSEATFAKFVEAHALMQDRDREGAKAIFEELGLQRPGKGHGPRGMHGEGGHEERQAIRDAVKAGDYGAWLEAMAEHPHADELDLSEEAFAQLQEAHGLMQAGDKEGAKAIFDALGIGPKHEHDEE